MLFPAGTKIYGGAPAQLLPEETEKRIKQELSRIQNIEEAHLPMCYIPTRMQKPEIVLCIVTNEKDTDDQAMAAVNGFLRRILPQGQYLDVWSLREGHWLVQQIRDTESCVYMKEQI
jgi:hypothetical protein